MHIIVGIAIIMNYNANSNQNRAGRYDIKGKQYLKTGEKYYIADISLRYYLLGTQKADMSRSLENVVYLELLRRGYDVWIGKVNDMEVDFIATNEKGIEYYQVSLTVRNEETLARELKSLSSISDHNPKYLLTLDDDPESSHNGIRQMNALDWLLLKNEVRYLHVGDSIYADENESGRQ